jgi:hypothetical protein
MTNDLVKRLRQYLDVKLPNEAADRIEKLEEQLHYATGVADTNITGRLYAEGRIEKLEAALRNIKDLHDQSGPEDELVVMIRDNMTYFIVCKALEGKVE